MTISTYEAEKKHYKKNDFVLVKSLVPFHGQVHKALRSISHWLVSLLVVMYDYNDMFIDLFFNYLNVFQSYSKNIIILCK